MKPTTFASFGELLEDITFVASSPDTSIRNVYCDMDGVLANFVSGFRQLYPELTSAEDVDMFLRRPQAWRDVMREHPDLFAKLPMMKDATQLMSMLQRLARQKRINLFILTALPNEMLQSRANLDKRNWAYEHFRISPKRVLICRRSDKAKYAMIDKMEGRPASILIDDFGKNIREWQQKGTGIGILHKSAARSLTALATALQA